MNDKQVNIYAYNDNRGVFFYNGNNSSRDEVFDALKEDSKTSLAPKISGYKITEISGLGEDEAEIFTAEQGVGNGVFVTGQRVPEKYIDIVAVGSGPEAPEAYYNYAKDFHKIGEWYKLNVQYKGRWVKVKAMLKNVKFETGNVFRRQQITASYLIPDPTIDEYWHDIISLTMLPTYEISVASASENLESPVIDVSDYRSAGYPKLNFKLIFNEDPTNADADHKINVKFKFTYTDADGKKKTKNWTACGIYYDTANSNLHIYSSAIYQHNCYLYRNGEGGYINLAVKLDPMDRTHTITDHVYSTSTSQWEDLTARNNASFTSYVPKGIVIETVQIIVEKNNDIEAEITWEA